MIKNLTQSDILGYVYNDVQGNQSDRVLEAIVLEEKLTNDFIELSEAKELLNKCTYSASSTTLDSILQYSKSQITESAS